ncbi:MFS transporter [Arenimonas aestuarii]
MAVPSGPEASAPPAESGPWAPLGIPSFRAIWLAILIGNIGTWVHDVAAAWLMADQTGSAFMVAAVQAATTLPVVMFAIVAGTLADIVDRRSYLIAAQSWMFFCASGLAVLAHFDLVTPWVLIGFTLAMGTGAAMAMPAQQALTPDLVPRPMLSGAIALGSLSMNIARSIGPALGGLAMAWSGAAMAFGINALSFLVLAVVLFFWRREPAMGNPLPREGFGTALRAGLRYAARAGTFQAVLVKSGLFFVTASAFTAQLPIVVNREMGAGAGTFGLLLGCIGVGAVSGALLLPRVRARFGPDRAVAVATLAYAACMAGLALVRVVPGLVAICLVAGLAWITILSSFQVAAQTSVPSWVRARALSLYIVVFSAGLASGSLGWGGLSQAVGIELGLLSAAGGTVVAAIVGLRFHLGPAGAADLAPSGHWPVPMVAGDIPGDRGPVVVTLEYRVPAQNLAAFLKHTNELGRMRRRNGAVQWGIAEDVSAPGTYFEYFIDASWLEHLRQHERVTGEDRQFQEALLALTEGPPRIRHFVGGAPSGSLRPMPAVDAGLS